MLFTHVLWVLFVVVVDELPYPVKVVVESGGYRGNFKIASGNSVVLATGINWRF